MGANVSPPITNFTAGEISPLLLGRSDLAKTRNACVLLENFIILPQGPLTRRPGLQYIGDCKDHTRKSRAVPFIFSTTQAYVLEFAHNAIRVFKDDGQVVNTPTDTTIDGMEVTTGWNSNFANSIATDTDKSEGTYSVNFSRITSDLATEYIANAYKNFGAPLATWANDKYLRFWVKASLPDRDHQQWYVEFGEGGYAEQQFRFPTPADATWVLVTVDISGVAGTSRDGVQYIRIRCEWPNVTTIPVGSYLKLDWIHRRTETPVEVTTTYTESELFDLKFRQSNDVLFIAHPSHPPARLTRTSHTAWVLQDANFLPPPTYEAGFSDNIQLTLSAASIGAGRTITAASSCFLDGDVGRRISAGTGLLIITAVASGTSATGDILYAFAGTVLAGNTWLMEGTSRTALNQSSTPVRAAPGYKITLDCNGGVASFRTTDEGKWLYMLNGCAIITERVSSTQVRAIIRKRLETTDGKVGAGTWTLESPKWTATLGYPAALCFIEQRLIWGSSPRFPHNLCMSVTGDYENHGKGTLDDDALDITLDANTVQNICWMADTKVLLIGTRQAELRLGASGVGEAIAPTNIERRVESKWGSANVEAVNMGNAVLFVQAGGATMRELGFALDVDGYATPSLTILAPHVLGSGVTQMDLQRNPVTIVWCVRSDGQAAALTYERREDVVGWSRLVTDGAVESVAVIPGTGIEDQVWMTVRRVVNGNTRRFMERLKPIDFGSDVRDAAYFDAMMTYSGTETLQLLGLLHLAGATVQVLADGGAHPAVVVGADGGITLQAPASKVQVGLAMTGRMQSAPIETTTPEGASMGKIQRVHGAIVRFYRTNGGQIGTSLAALESIPFRYPEDLMDTPVPLADEDIPVTFPAEHERRSQICAVTEQGFPMTILSITPRLSVNDG
jgi:hypothetical protein